MSIDNATQEELDGVARDAQTAARWVENGFSLKTLNAHLARPFGKVALVDRCLAFALWSEGYRFEYRREDSPGDWRAGDPCWSPELCYRALPKPEELVLPSIDWSQVAPKWKWLAQDKDEGLWLYTEMPKTGAGGWSNVSGDCADVSGVLAALVTGKGDWKKLIVQRPEGA